MSRHLVALLLFCALGLLTHDAYAQWRVVEPTEVARSRSYEHRAETARRLKGHFIDMTTRNGIERLVAASPDGSLREANLKVPLFARDKSKRAQISTLMSEYHKGRETDVFMFHGDLGKKTETTRSFAPKGLTAMFSGPIADSIKHAANFADVLNAKLKISNTRFGNFIPFKPSDLDAIGVGGTSKDWSAARYKYNAFLQNRKVLSEVQTKNDMLNALSSHGDVVVLLAHGDSKSIYLSATERLTVDDINKLKPPDSPEGQRRPIVVLFSCETGKLPSGRESLAGANTIASALVARGWASAVFAPVEQIPLEDSTIELFEQLVHDDVPLKEIIRRTQYWQLHVRRKANQQESEQRES